MRVVIAFFGAIFALLSLVTLASLLEVVGNLPHLMSRAVSPESRMMIIHNDSEAVMAFALTALILFWIVRRA